MPNRDHSVGVGQWIAGKDQRANLLCGPGVAAGQLEHRRRGVGGDDADSGMRKKAGLTQAEVADTMGVTQQRVSAIENGAIAELATLADYIRAIGGELKVIADFGDSWRRVA
jgi:Helix-turn-helix